MLRKGGVFRAGRVGAMVLVIFLGANCDAGSFVGPANEDPSGQSSIRVDAIAGLVAEDDIVPLSATVVDPAGQPIAGATLTWSSSDEEVAFVQATGATAALLTALKPGTTTISASYETLTASATLQVHSRPVDLSSVAGSGQEAEAGATLPDSLVVHIVDRRGDGVVGIHVDFEATAGGGAVSPARVTTDAGGFARAAWTLGPSGEQTATARTPDQPRIDQVKDSMAVFTALAVEPVTMTAMEVRPARVSLQPGGTQSFQAVALMSDGSEAAVTPTWSATGGTISGAGVYSAGPTEGSFRVVATYESAFADTAIVSVQQAIVPVATVTVWPATVTMEVGGTIGLTATVRDAAGNALEDRVVSWSSGNTSVATVSSGGVITGAAAGQTAVVATADGVSGNATVTVITPAMGAVKILSPPDTLFGIGSSVTLAAEARWADGSSIPSPGITWTSRNPGIVTVDSMGRLTAQALGTAVIVAAAICCVADSVAAVVAPASASPGTVSDLQVTAAGANFVTLVWTQVNDGTGQPANYAVRYGSPTLSWENAGATEVQVQGTAVGASISYTFSGLQASTTYEFRLVPYRLEANPGTTFGSLSNSASTTTQAEGPGARPDRYPNEPAGFVPWFEHDWQTWPSEVGERMMGSGAGLLRLGPSPADINFALVDDPDAPHGKGKSLRFRRAAGTRNGSGSGTFNIYHPKPGAGTSVAYADQVKLRSVYRSHWVYLEPDPVTNDFMFGGTHMRMFWWNRLLGAARGGNISLRAPNTWDGSSYQRSTVWHGLTNWYIKSVPQAVEFLHGNLTLGLGQWYHIESLWETEGRYNSEVTETNYSNNDDEAGMNNSRVRTWIDGQLVVDTIITHHVRAPLANEHFSMVVLLGSSSYSLEQDDFIRFGDIYVSGRVETW
jgi:uncharacterized protein YjdB